MAVEVYWEWRGGRRVKWRPPRPWSYFQRPRRSDDLSTRHDPATAISDEGRWYNNIDEPISTIIVFVWLFLAGLVETIGYYVFILFQMLIVRKSTIIVERDGQIIERHEVTGWLEGTRRMSDLRGRYSSINR